MGKMNEIMNEKTKDLLKLILIDILSVAFLIGVIWWAVSLKLFPSPVDWILPIIGGFSVAGSWLLSHSDNAKKPKN